MTDSNQHVEKAGLSVVSMILMILGLVIFLVFMITKWLQILVPPYTFILSGVSLIIVIVGMAITETIRKKGYGIKKVNALSNYLAIAYIVVLIINIILGFVLPSF